MFLEVLEALLLFVHVLRLPSPLLLPENTNHTHKGCQYRRDDANEKRVHSAMYFRQRVARDEDCDHAEQNREPDTLKLQRRHAVTEARQLTQLLAYLHLLGSHE